MRGAAASVLERRRRRQTADGDVAWRSWHGMSENTHLGDGQRSRLHHHRRGAALRHASRGGPYGQRCEPRAHARPRNASSRAACIIDILLRRGVGSPMSGPLSRPFQGRASRPRHRPPCQHPPRQARGSIHRPQAPRRAHRRPCRRLPNCCLQTSAARKSPSQAPPPPGPTQPLSQPRTRRRSCS
eukprot:356295-Chlamydomonas_euryale.AAC.6